MALSEEFERITASERLGQERSQELAQVPSKASAGHAGRWLLMSDAVDTELGGVLQKLKEAQQETSKLQATIMDKSTHSEQQTMQARCTSLRCACNVRSFQGV